MQFEQPPKYDANFDAPNLLEIEFILEAIKCQGYK